MGMIGTRCRRVVSGVVKAKLVVIGVVLAGKAAIHWEWIDGKPAKWVEFGADSLHLVFSGVAASLE